ncbi:histone deacetylase sin3 component [Moniliophthora roreri MCA 2997]|uniref:Histone deacetylase sin3 component n=1 Tax=Moniliophthora roreri (strain MCA 2997) TaxID=1381753 RepID=V2XTZ1_MONRO|nr:histone deacetylase sin3 component [Moniliophthora roreri MCA 2997]
MDPRAAIAYIQKVQQRCNPEAYKQFLDILSRYHRTPETITEGEVSSQIARLFEDAPDLLAEFRVFIEQSQSVRNSQSSVGQRKEEAED